MEQIYALAVTFWNGAVLRVRGFFNSLSLSLFYFLVGCLFVVGFFVWVGMVFLFVLFVIFSVLLDFWSCPRAYLHA